jgi:hypothetical protein
MRELPPVIYLGQSEQSRTILAVEKRKARLEQRKVWDKKYEAKPERRAYKHAYDQAYSALPEVKERKKAYDAWRWERGRR